MQGNIMKQNNLRFIHQQQHRHYESDFIDKGLTQELMCRTVRSYCIMADKTLHVFSQNQRIECIEDKTLAGSKQQDKRRDLLS